jgi:hypothetical protein
MLVLGTSGQGQTEWPYVVSSSALAAQEFGGLGTLTRGMYETKNAGAQNVILYRLGATSAKIEHIGDSAGVGGYTVETLRRDDDAGSIYSIYYDDASDRLIVWNEVTGIIVYDNDSSDPVDLGEVIVSGSRAAAGGPDIAGPSQGIAMEDLVPGHTGLVYTAGTDADNPSRMELYEYLYKAYKILLSQDFDWVVPMDTYLDDKNIVDGDTFSASYIAGIVSGGTYPTASGDDDILGKLYVEEYQGDFYFFWDLNGDGVAELYPDGVGLASSTTNIAGDSLSTTSFHEINFAYQLARFCHEVSTNTKFCLGVIGTRPPASLAPADISVWIGKAPSYSTRSDGSKYIARYADNGSGLLGNKFKAGNYTFRSGEGFGGFILTDSEYLDSTELTDNNDFPVDIGRYISVVAASVRLFNAFDTSGRGYVTTAAPSYLGFTSSLDEQIAPTNKVIRGMQRVFDIRARLVDQLATAGYVYIWEKPKGLTVSDAPTGARPTSDFRRLTTMRIIKRVSGAVRDAADPFIGNSFSDGRRDALDNAIGEKLNKLRSAGYITRYTKEITQTRAQKVTGIADLRLVMVPAWELRQLTVDLSLAPQ